MTGGALAERHPGVALLVWTTTPWTLVSNTAVAVHPEVDLRRGRAPPASELLVVAEDLRRGHARRGRHEVLSRCTGARAGAARATRGRSTWSRSPTRHYVDPRRLRHHHDGSGLVHLAPAFGADDLAVCRAYGLPVVNPVLPDGTLRRDVPLVGGQFFKKADEALVADLRARGLLFKHVPLRARLPALLALPHPADLLRAAVLVHPHDARSRTQLLRENEATNWYPADHQVGPLRRLADATTSTGRCRATATGARRCRSGAAQSDHLTVRRVAAPSWASWPASDLSATWTRTGRSSTTSPSPCPQCERDGHAACPRSSTAGTTPARCRSRSWATRTANAERVRARRTRPTSSARPSTRPAAGSTR